MKQVIRLTESDLHRIISESVNRILKETRDFIDEEEVLVTDEDVFGDNEEHAYDFRCYDGYAEGQPSRNWDEEYEEELPQTLHMTYPKLEEVLNDEDMTNYILKYRGLHDLGPEDITYGDIMIALGEVEV